MSKIKSRILVITVVIFILVLGSLGVISRRPAKVKMNPAGTVGNTAGNLNNKGLFCERNGKVYFSNPQDGGTLYVMNPDESEKKKLNDMQVRNILAGGDYLYYYQVKSADSTGFGKVANTHAMNRCDLSGKNAVNITRDAVLAGQLVDNYLYLMTSDSSAPLFYKIKIDKSEQVRLAEYTINPACVSNGRIYYNNTRNDHNLYALNTANDTEELVWAGNLWYPVIEGDYVYFLDVGHDYRLCRYSLSEQVVEVLTNDRVDCFNVGSGYIYYQKNSAANPQLICMHTDGSNVIAVAEGIFTNINMTSQYVYFQEFNAEESLYHSRLGSDWYASF